MQTDFIRSSTLHPRRSQNFAVIYIQASGNRPLDNNIALCDIATMAQIVFAPTAMRQWLKLSPDVRERIRKKLNVLAASGHGDVKKLRGQGGSRLRVGDWRVVYYEEAGTIVVAGVGHRREIYD